MPGKPAERVEICRRVGIDGVNRCRDAACTTPGQLVLRARPVDRSPRMGTRGPAGGGGRISAGDRSDRGAPAGVECTIGANRRTRTLLGAGSEGCAVSVVLIR